MGQKERQPLMTGKRFSIRDVIVLGANERVTIWQWRFIVPRFTHPLERRYEGIKVLDLIKTLESH